MKIDSLTYILAIAMIIPSLLFSAPLYELEPIVVTGTRIPTKLSELTRSVSVLTKEEIESMPVHSVPELLNYLIDMRQRNIYGVQSDVSIRGSSFEQVLVLIDGVPVSDPQTGHHNLNIPLALDDIERIEILRGHGSSLYGANAFGGVINIITVKPSYSKKLSIETGGSYGSYGTYTGKLTNMFQIKGLGNRLSFVKQKSDGYKYNTDFDNSSLSFSSNFKNLVTLYLGFVDKDFGAHHFYGPYPSKERTKTKFLMAGFKPLPTIEPKFYYREHYDKFILLRENPVIYTNYHTNYRYGVELTCYIGNVVLGTEVNEERIKSTGIRRGVEVSALGAHTRRNAGIYGEYRIIYYKRFLATVGGRVDYNSQYGVYFSPSLSMGYTFSDRLKLRSSAGKSFRAPSFTELYYKDPANIGDSTLKAEEAWGYEIGTDYKITENIKSSATLFMRVQDNLIDWVRTDTALPWRAKNIREAVTKGMEGTLKMGWEQTSFAVDYTFLVIDSEIEGKYFSKYALNYPEHQFSVKLEQSLGYGIKMVIGSVVKQRLNDQAYFVLDAQVSKNIGRGLVLIKGTNLLDTKYEEIAGIEMPGRWVSIALKLNI